MNETTGQKNWDEGHFVFCTLDLSDRSLARKPDHTLLKLSWSIRTRLVAAGLNPHVTAGNICSIKIYDLNDAEGTKRKVEAALKGIPITLGLSSIGKEAVAESNAAREERLRGPTEIEPGSFRLEKDPYPQTARSSEHFEQVADISDADSEIGKVALLVQQEFGSPKRILYPASGAHDVDRIFPKSEVTYVDPAQGSTDALRKAVPEGSRIHTMGIEDFAPEEQFDLLLSLNSHADMAEQLKHLKPGGLVFCGNYFGTKDAEHVIQLGGCELLAVVEYEGPEENLAAVLLKDGLDPYLTFDDSRGEDYVGAKREKVASYYVFRKKPE